MDGNKASGGSSQSDRSDVRDPLARPIDVSGLLVGGGDDSALRSELRERLSELRRHYPQIPGDRRRLEALVEQLLAGVADAMRQADASAGPLSARLRTLRMRGLGQANALWSRLFVVVPNGTAPAAVSMAHASRADLSERLRVALQGHHPVASGKLERIVAGVLAWRPRSLDDLCQRLVQGDPQLPEVSQLARLLAPHFTFAEPSPSDREGTAAPDWSVLWRLNAQSAYGGEYPRSVKACLQRFFADVCERDPIAELLDIGTGNHTATVLARRTSPRLRLYGIDVTRIAPPPAQARVGVARMRAESLAFRDGQFGAIMSINGIEYADVKRAFPEMVRVMRSGAVALTVMHRPDSSIVAGSRQFMELLHTTPILELLEMAWLYLDGGEQTTLRELDSVLAELEMKQVDVRSVQFYGVLLDGVRRAIRMRRSAPDEAYRLIQRFDNDLRWAYDKGRFLTSHMAAIPTDRQDFIEWLHQYGFAIEAVEALVSDDAADRSPVGWGVRLRKP